MARAQHIGQFANLLSVENRLMERLGEIVRAQNRQVGVGALLFFIRMTIDHREIVIVILLGHETPWILAEGPNLVFEGRGIADEFGFIKNLLSSSMTSLRTSTRTPISTGPGLWAISYFAQIFSNQSAPRRPERSRCLCHKTLFIPIAIFMDDHAVQTPFSRMRSLHS
jgi:hypothetical protein